MASFGEVGVCLWLCVLLPSSAKHTLRNVPPTHAGGFLQRDQATLQTQQTQWKPSHPLAETSPFCQVIIHSVTNFSFLAKTGIMQ